MFTNMTFVVMLLTLISLSCQHRLARFSSSIVAGVMSPARLFVLLPIVRDKKTKLAQEMG